MPGVDFYTAESYLARNENWIAAIAIVVVAFIAAKLVDRALARQGKTVSTAHGAAASSRPSPTPACGWCGASCSR